MKKIGAFSSEIDLRYMEKLYEDLYMGDEEMEMKDDEVDVGLIDEVVASASDVVHFTFGDEERERKQERRENERKANRWLARRKKDESRRRFMEDLCKYWPQFEVLMEYEVSEMPNDKVSEIACCSDVSNSDDELDPVAIRESPVITKWFIGVLSKYWPGFT